MKQPLLVELQKCYRAGDLVLFAGAGVSQAGGLPSWEGLICRLIKSAEAEDTTGALVDVLTRARTKLDRRDLVAALSTVERGIPRTTFVRMVKDALDDRGHEIPPVARAIAELGQADDPQRGLRALITTNLDRFLERAFDGRWPDTVAPTFDLAQQRQYILKLHGTRQDSETWVLTQGGYETLLHKKPEQKDFLRALFLTCKFLFVGYGMRDPDFDLLLGWLRTFARDQPPQHFALMAEGSVDEEDRHQLALGGIDVIFYPNPDKRHTKAIDMLRSLREATPRAVLPTREIASRAPSQPRSRGPASARGSRPINAPSINPGRPVRVPGKDDGPTTRSHVLDAVATVDHELNEDGVLGTAITAAAVAEEAGVTVEQVRSVFTELVSADVAYSEGDDIKLYDKFWKWRKRNG